MPLLNIYCLSNSDIYKESIAKDVHGIVSLEAVAADMMHCPGERKSEWGSVAELEICSYVCHI